MSMNTMSLIAAITIALCLARPAIGQTASTDLLTGPGATGTPPAELRVSGNQILTPDGKPVWLQGVNVASLEWTPIGENVLRSIDVAISDWNANVIRLPVTDRFWYGQNEHQHDGGEAYRKLIDDSIAAATSRGAYVIIDLHEYKAPKPEHVRFWTDLANRYKDNPAVMFGLLNEPHSITWEIWRDGGTVEERRPAPEGVIAENNQIIETFESPGMQKIVDAVRDTGAKNILVIGGLDWAYDLSGVVNGFALDDRGGRGIIYDTHIYPWKDDWAGKVLGAAERYPILVGEVGAPQERFDFIPPERHEDPSTWVPDMLGFIQQHHLNWTAWCFHPSASPVLLQDWDYTPTNYWGAPAKRALSGEKFEMKRMR